MLALVALLEVSLCGEGATVLWSNSANSGKLQWWDVSNWANKT